MARHSLARKPFLLGALVCAFLMSLASPSLRAEATTEPSDGAANLPTLYIVGDSTVKNRGILVGWGDPIQQFFDTSRIHIENHAMAGRSSRTFISEGRWEAVRAKLKQGDFVLMQFGHNDSKSKISMTRYSLPGLGDETEEGIDHATSRPETIHTFGYYMKKMATETQAAGATPILLSPVPRCRWAEGKIVRGEERHGQWAAQVGREVAAPFVDINSIIADIYDPIGSAKIKALYFPQDGTHTNIAGAKVNAASVVKGLLMQPDLALNGYLKPGAKEMSEALIGEVPKAAERVQLPATTHP